MSVFFKVVLWNNNFIYRDKLNMPEAGDGNGQENWFAFQNTLKEFLSHREIWGNVCTFIYHFYISCFFFQIQYYFDVKHGSQAILHKLCPPSLHRRGWISRPFDQNLGAQDFQAFFNESLCFHLDSQKKIHQKSRFFQWIYLISLDFLGKKNKIVCEIPDFLCVCVRSTGIFQGVGGGVMYVEQW